MKEGDKRESSRRDFLKESVVTVLGVGYFGGVALDELLAAAQKSGKPLLTPEAFTARIPTPRRKQEFHRELAAIRKDLVGYVDNNFYLPPGQLENFRRIPKQDIVNLNDALTTAEGKGLKVVVQTALDVAECADAKGFRLKTIVEQETLFVRAYRT